MLCSHDESDLSVRLVEVWYDTLWGLFMSNTVDHVAKRLNHRRKMNSSSASVASTIAPGSMVGKGVAEKLRLLDTQLKNIRKYMKARQFEDICKVALKSHDELYPGFKDILIVAQYLLLHGDAYKDTLTHEEIRGLTLTLVFQEIFYQLCSFLTTSQVGKEASKLVVAPSQITNAAYDICRQKFCRLVCEETSIVQYGLFEVITKTLQERESDPNGVLLGEVDDTTEQSVVMPTETPAAPSNAKAKKVAKKKAQTAVDTVDTITTVTTDTVDKVNNTEAVDTVTTDTVNTDTVDTEAEVVVDPSPPIVGETTPVDVDDQASVVSTRTSGSRRPSLTSVPFLTPVLDRNTRILKFPVIELSSDSEDEDGASSVSSLGEDEEDETFLVRDK